MSHYQITITLTEDQVNEINARGLYVTLAKQNPATVTPDFNAVWVTFPPATTTLSWQDSYSVYALTTMENAAVIETFMLSAPGESWTFSNANFLGPNTLGSPSYGIVNDGCNHEHELCGLLCASVVGWSGTDDADNVGLARACQIGGPSIQREPG